MGSFGGTYYRPIYSQVVEQQLKNQHKEYPDSWFEGLDIPKQITSSVYNKEVNTYKVKCGQSLMAWEESGWISNLDPYGWFQWYCRYFLGRRTDDDERQIQRWNNFCGEKGRWRNYIYTKIFNKETTINDLSFSLAVRQSLLHWGYMINEEDFSMWKLKNGI